MVSDTWTLDGVKVARWDADHEVLFLWWGGHGVHGWQPQETGQWAEVLYWNTGDFGESDATEKEVQHSITEHTQLPEEEFWSFC